MPLNSFSQRPLPRSVLGRLIMVVLLALLLIDILFFFPMIVRNRGWWLDERMLEARALVALLESGQHPVSATTADWLAQVPDIERLRIVSPGPARDLLPFRPMPPGLPRIPMAHNYLWRAIPQAIYELRHRNPGLAVLSFSALGKHIEVTVDRHNLHRSLMRFFHRFQVYILILNLVVLLFLFYGLRGLIVRPLERMTERVAEFGADPRRRAPLDPGQITPVPDDEIARLAQTLADMQADLQSALWREARLAALGTAVAKMSHDLRGILTPAMLAADRLALHSPDPQSRAAGDAVIRAVQNATNLAQSVLAFAREGPPPPARTDVAVHDIVQDAAGQVLAETGPDRQIINEIDPTLTCLADRESLRRVVFNLLRNAIQAGAHTISLSAHPDDDGYVLHIADDGPGLPPDLMPRLFRPFAPSTTGGTGLGLAIARDLMRALGGDLALDQTGPTGTIFRLVL